MSLSFLLLLWSQHTPSFGKVLSVLHSADNTRVASLHASSGAVCIWRVSELPSPSPSSPITTDIQFQSATLDACVTKNPSSDASNNLNQTVMMNDYATNMIAECTSASGPAIALVNHNGCISLILWSDGRCVVRSATSLVNVPTAACSITVGGGNQRFLAIATMACVVSIIDTVKMSVLLSIESRETNMISTISPGMSFAADTISLVAACADKVLVYWNISVETDARDSSSHKLKLQHENAVPIPYTSPVACCVCEGNPLLLIVFTEVWMIYVYGVEAPVYICEERCEHLYSGGFWCDNRRVCIEYSSGDLVVIEVPEKSISTGIDMLRSNKMESQASPRSNALFRSLGRLVHSPTKKKEHADPFANTGVTSPLTSSTGSSAGGIVSVMHTASEKDLFLPNPFESGPGRWVALTQRDHIIALGNNSIQAYCHKSELPISGLSSFTVPFKESKFVTSSIIDISGDSATLIEGHEDGSLSVCAIGGSSLGQWPGHKAPVNSLLCYVSPVGSRILVSACLHGKVKVWNLSKQSLIKSYSYHTTPITNLIIPPEALRTRHNISFASLSEDSTCVLYNHAADVILILGNPNCVSVKNLYWSVAKDTCSIMGKDGSTAVWHLSTGTLERLVRGNSSAALIHKLALNSGAGGEATGQASNAVPTPSVPKLSLFNFCTIMNPPLMGACHGILIDVKKLLIYIKDVTTTVPESERRIPGIISTLFAYLLHGEHEEIVSKLVSVLGLSPNPQPISTCAVHEKGFLTMYGVQYSQRLHAYNISPAVSGTRMLTTLSLMYSSIQLDPPLMKGPAKEGIMYVASTLPGMLVDKQFHSPTFLTCLEFLAEENRDLQFAARCTASTVLRNYTKEELDALSLYLERTPGDHIAIAIAVLILHTLNTETGDAVKPPRCPGYQVERRLQSIGYKGLLSIVKRSLTDDTLRTSGLNSTALTLFGDAFPVWSNLIPEISEFYQLGFDVISTGEDNETNSSAALRMLAIAGAINASSFLQFLEERVGDNVSTTTAEKEKEVIRCRKTALQVLQAAVKKSPVKFQSHVFRLMAIITKVLHPHFPKYRDACMQVSSQFLKSVLAQYPSMSFHQQQQRLLGGDTNGQVLIYDMRTASKWVVWMAHTAAVTCASFSTVGDEIATYCQKTNEIKVWRCESSSFGMLEPSCKCMMTVPCAPLAPCSAEDMLRYVRLAWVSPQALELKTKSEGSRTYQLTKKK
eukprot:PhF_6_TR44144/c0_g1_i2/m.67506